MATVIQRVRSKVLYRGHVLDLSLDTYRPPEGEAFLRETIHHPASVVITPLLDDGSILLIRQFRHAVGRVIYEIPAGTSEPGEPLLSCAKRELAEETGYSARRWQRLCQFYPAPGISTERMVAYAARGLKPLKKPIPMDKDEQITVEVCSQARALDLIRTNRIVDAKTIIGLLWAMKRIRWS